MKMIQDELYRMLAADYVEDGEDSVIYRHYLQEYRETVATRKKTGAEKKQPRLNPCEQIMADYGQLDDNSSEKERYLFLANVFQALAAHEALYNQPMILKAPAEPLSSDIPEWESSDDAALQIDHYQIAPSDFACILEVVSPFLSAGLHLTSEQLQELSGKRSKNILHRLIQRLSEAIQQDDSVEQAFAEAGLLQADSEETKRLYRHIITRSIDKTYKDFLYSAGYRLLNIQGNEGPILRKSKTRKSEGGSRTRREKRDRTMMLLEDICRKKGITLLTQSVNKNLSAPSFVMFCQDLYQEVNQNKDSLFVQLIDVDVQTGCSLQLVGSYYLPDDIESSCAFVILRRTADEQTYTYEIWGDEEADDSDTYYFDFPTALEEYRLVLEDARISLRAAQSRTYAETDSDADSPIRQATLEDILSPYEDEEDANVL